MRYLRLWDPSTGRQRRKRKRFIFLSSFRPANPRGKCLVINLLSHLELSIVFAVNGFVHVFPVHSIKFDFLRQEPKHGWIILLNYFQYLMMKKDSLTKQIDFTVKFQSYFLCRIRPTSNSNGPVNWKSITRIIRYFLFPL